MAFVHGKDSYFMINSKELTAYIDSAQLQQSVDTAESSTMGNEAKTYLSGLSDATLSIAGKYDSTGTTGPDAVLNALVGNDSAVEFDFGPEGGTTGKVKYTGNCFLTAYNISAPIGDVVAFTAEFQVTGTISKTTFS